MTDDITALYERLNKAIHNYLIGALKMCRHECELCVLQGTGGECFVYTVDSRVRRMYGEKFAASEYVEIQLKTEKPNPCENCAAAFVPLDSCNTHPEAACMKPKVTE